MGSSLSKTTGLLPLAGPGFLLAPRLCGTRVWVFSGLRHGNKDDCQGKSREQAATSSIGSRGPTRFGSFTGFGAGGEPFADAAARAWMDPGISTTQVADPNLATVGQPHTFTVTLTNDPVSQRVGLKDLSCRRVWRSSRRCLARGICDASHHAGNGVGCTLSKLPSGGTVEVVANGEPRARAAAAYWWGSRDSLSYSMIRRAGFGKLDSTTAYYSKARRRQARERIRR